MNPTRTRLADAARLLPFAGAAAMLAPDLILSDAQAAENATVPWLAYLFGAWAVLIGATAWLTYAHRRAATPEEEGEGGGRDGT